MPTSVNIDAKSVKPGFFVPFAGGVVQLLKYGRVDVLRVRLLLWKRASVPRCRRRATRA
jgi:hypothetical protein